MASLRVFLLVMLGTMSPGCGGNVNTCGTGATGATGNTNGSGGTKPSNGVTGGTAGTSAGGSAANSVNTADRCSGLVRLYTFDESLQGFAFNTTAATHTGVNLAAIGEAGVANPSPSDAGVASFPATLRWSDLADHDVDAVYPHKGAMEITAVFSDTGQQLYLEMGDAAHPLVDPCGNRLNLSQKVLHVQVRLDNGLSPLAGYCDHGPLAGIALYLKTGTNLEWSQSYWACLTPGAGWEDIAFDTRNPTFPVPSENFSPADPASIGIVISSGWQDWMDGPFASPLPTTIYVDDITMEPQL